MTGWTRGHLACQDWGSAGVNGFRGIRTGVYACEIMSRRNTFVGQNAKVQGIGSQMTKGGRSRILQVWSVWCG